MQIFLTVVCIIAAIAGIVLAVIADIRRAIVREDKEMGRTPKDAKVAFTSPKPFVLITIISLALLLVVNSVTIIPTGYTGVKTVFGQTSEQGLPKGLNFKLPFVEKIDLVNNKRQQRVYKDRIWGETSATDKVQVYGEGIHVTYAISPERSAWLKVNVSVDTDNLITGADLSTALKAAMKTFTPDVVTDRDLIQPLTAENLNEVLATKWGEGTIEVFMVEIDQMDYEDAYNQALAEKAVAAKKQEEQAIANKTAIEKAEADKKVAITNAESVAEAAKIKAQGDAEARLIQVKAEEEASKRIDQYITDNVLKNKFYNAWNGQLPNVMGDGTVITSITP